MSDEKLFGAATREFSTGVVDEDLLAKARVLAGGEGKRTEIEYIKLRVQQLKSDNRSQLLRTASGTVGTKVSSVKRVLRYYVTRNRIIGIVAFFVFGTSAALLVTNEVNGTCERLRVATDNYQSWVEWFDDQGVDVREMRLAPYDVLVEKYGQEVADKRRGFRNSSTELRIAENALNFTEFCF